MILLHRLTPFALAASLLAGFGILVYWPTNVWQSALVLFVLCPLLLARLLLFEVRRPAFWVFLTTPMFLIASSFFFFLFLEARAPELLVGLVVATAVSLYSENLFTFYHLPHAYQAYTLEYLTLVMASLGVFFYMAGLFAAHIFLFIPNQLPLWIPALVTFFVVFILVLAMFWVSKIGFETGRRYALVGAVIMTELYAALSLLPISYVAGAAAFATFFYLYIGLMRAHVLERLTPAIVRRYSALALVLLAIIFGTARWL